MPVLQSAYVYVVALVAIHMVVLAVANLLRVAAEVALGAPSGGFTGLPFLFAEGRSQPGDLYREHLSLAIALLLVGAPMWILHFRAAQRAAERDPVQRGSPLRAAYLQVVIFVTALLVFAYAQSALRQALEASLIEPLKEAPLGLGGPSGDPSVAPARVAGAFAMVAAAGVALGLHLRLARADLAMAAVSRAAAVLWRWRAYLLIAIGLVFALFGGITLLSAVWDWIWAPGDPVPPFVPPGEPVRDIDLRGQIMRSAVANGLPPLLAGLGLWAASWRGVRRRTDGAGADAAAELRSAIRALALYGIVFVSVLGTLFAASASLSVLVRRLLFQPLPTDVPLLREIGDAWPPLVLFGLSWWWHWRVTQGDAAREDEAARAATIRRTYVYLVSTIALLLLAIGAAGVVGVLGSVVIGQQTHQPDEIAGYVTLVLVGLPVWLFHILRAHRRAAADVSERDALPRRVYLYLAILGGILAVLVFGSAALFRILTGVLALSFTLDLVHDVMHLVVDTAVGVTVAGYHWRVLRADRATLAPQATVEERGLVLIAHGAARERLAALSGGGVAAFDVSARTAAELADRLGREGHGGTGSP